jgi:transposase-like protein
MSEDQVINELTKIKGLTKKQAVKLYRAGIKSIKKLGSSNPDELSRITGIAKKQLTTWVILARAQERKKFIEVDAAAEELSQLVEIKMEDAKALVSAGVMSIDDLAEESADLLSEDTGINVNTISGWVKKAKEVKKIPPEKRKVVIVPSAEISFGSKMSGAFLGSSSGFSNIYNDSSSFGQSLIFVVFTNLFLWLYLSMSQATFGTWSLTDLWSTLYLDAVSMVFTIGTLQITFYPMVLLVGIILTIVIWLVLGKIVSSARNLEFKNTSAVLGFAMAPGILLVVVLVGKFAPVDFFHVPLAVVSGIDLYLLTILLIVFGVWVALVFVRGLVYSPRGAKISPSSLEMGAPKAQPAESVLQVVEEGRPGVTPPPMAPPTTPQFRAPPTGPPARAPPTAPPFSAPAAPTAQVAPAAPARTGPMNLNEFGNLIDAASLSALQNTGFNTSIDLLKASSKDIAERTQIAQSKIIIWRIISDLLRIPGISLEAALILTKSGVRSVKHLAKINENALKVQVLDTISKENITTAVTAQMLSAWIAKAKTL